MNTTIARRAFLTLPIAAALPGRARAAKDWTGRLAGGGALHSCYNYGIQSVGMSDGLGVHALRLQSNRTFNSNQLTHALASNL